MLFPLKNVPLSDVYTLIRVHHEGRGTTGGALYLLLPQRQGGGRGKEGRGQGRIGPGGYGQGAGRCEGVGGKGKEGKVKINMKALRI